MASNLKRKRKATLAPVEDIDRRIVVLRGQRVLLDSDLAALYGVPTKRFNEQVRRNLDRFPPDFTFQLNNQDFVVLRSQIATLRTGHGQHRKYRPRAFTEHGAIMAATVLNSARAVEMSVYVVRAFVRMREVISQSKEIHRYTRSSPSWSSASITRMGRSSRSCGPSAGSRPRHSPRRTSPDGRSDSSEQGHEKGRACPAFSRA